MNSIQFFETELLLWFQKEGRDHLPWRKQGITPYEVWVSEVMLQQTQVSRVIEYYKKFLHRFPTIFDLARASWEDFYPYYAGLGYYNRGRNMLLCAQKIVEMYNGIFPQEKEKLKQLPGIGEYTASAILSFGYNKNELAVDTNIKKVFGRYFAGAKDAAVDFKSLQKDLSAPKKQLNAAIMDFSNSICIKIPRCGECPVQKQCVYYSTDGQKEFVPVKSKKIFPTKDARVELTLHKNHKEYYSLSKKKYIPFLLPKKYNTRESIKEYFQKKYGLTLAVRPPHKKVFLQGEPVLLVNAQILVGKHEFTIFQKDKI